MFASIVLVLLSVLIVGLIVWEYKQRHPKTDLALPPMIGPFEILLKKNENIIALFGRLRKKYGPIFRLRVPFYADAVFLVGADMSRLYHMVKEDEAGFNYGYKLFLSLGFGPTHMKEYGREPGFIPVLERAFSRERFNHFARVTRAGHLNYMKTFWNKDIQQVDLFSEMYALNIRLVIRAFLGDIEEEKLLQLIETVKSLDLEERVKSISTVIHNFSPPGRKELEAHWFATVDLVKELVKARANNTNEGTSLEFLDFLIKETTDDKGVIDYGLLTCRVFGLIFVAILNTFATSAWFLFRVFDNPEIFAKVKKEQEEYYSYLEDPQAELGTLLINKFPFSENCIREVVRTSNAGISFRRAKQDFILHENDIQYLVRKDSYLIMPYSTITRDPNIHRDPEVFRPERWDTEAKGACENVNFGAGRHPCTGTKFAMLNVKNIAFNLMAHYDVSVPGKAEEYMPKLQHMGVFRPIKPVIFTLRKRKEIGD